MESGIHLLTTWSGVSHRDNYPALIMSILNHHVHHIPMWTTSEKFWTQRWLVEVNHVVLEILFHLLTFLRILSMTLICPSDNERPKARRPIIDVQNSLSQSLSGAD